MQIRTNDNMNIDETSFVSRFKSETADNLFKAILSLENLDDCYRFFDDLCTINELAAMIQRFEVMQMLSEGKTFNTIAELTGASTATIARVNRSLHHGANGYLSALKRMNNMQD